MQVEELEALLNARIIQAYTLGMSVVEITTALRKTNVAYVHSLLREAGCIRAMVRSEYRRSYDVDHRIEGALRNKGYSFGRWCLGWKLDPEAAAAALKMRPEDASSILPHDAVLRDFQEIYQRIFGTSRPWKKRRPAAAPFHPAVTIVWDCERSCYVGRIVEHPEMEATGIDWDEVVERLKTVLRLHRQVAALDAVMETLRNPAP